MYFSEENALKDLKQEGNKAKTVPIKGNVNQIK